MRESPGSESGHCMRDSSTESTHNHLTYVANGLQRVHSQWNIARVADKFEKTGNELSPFLRGQFDGCHCGNTLSGHSSDSLPRRAEGGKKRFFEGGCR